MEIEEIMDICRKALEERGCEIIAYTEANQRFTVKSGELCAVVNFMEDDLAN